MKKESFITLDFFSQNPLVCARELIGCTFSVGKCRGIIVETEAYLEKGDEACHTFSRKSARAFVAHHSSGTAYVYLNYGLYWLTNVLVKGEQNGFVLLRALQPTEGVSLMKRRRKRQQLKELCSGPGKLSRAFLIDRRFHGRSFVEKETCGFFDKKQSVDVEQQTRIGISKAVEKPWRFTLKGSNYVSK